MYDILEDIVTWVLLCHDDTIQRIPGQDNIPLYRYQIDDKPLWQIGRYGQQCVVPGLTPISRSRNGW